MPYFDLFEEDPTFEFLTGGHKYGEVGVEISYTFPNNEAIQSIYERFGDAIAAKEIVLVPSVNVKIEEPDEDDLLRGNTVRQIPVHIKNGNIIFDPLMNIINL